MSTFSSLALILLLVSERELTEDATDLEYARTALPALAAIIMSDRVKRGDMIDLALPHPEAWPETVAYVYSGSLGFLSDETKANVIYLGGKPGKKIPRGYGTRSYFACAPYWPPIRRG